MVVVSDARRADQRHDAAGAGDDGKRAAHVQLGFEHVSESGARGERIGQVEARLAAEAVDEFAGELLVDVGFDQVGEGIEERGRHFVLRRGTTA
jgi:hypothetical protein